MDSTALRTGRVGEAIHRIEDGRLLTGRGRFIDDLEPDALHAVFVRSEQAHARIVDIDVSGALSIPGLHGIYTSDDLEGPLAAPLPLIAPHPGIVARRTQRVLARDEVCYAGEAIAMVIAADRYVAEDAAATIRVRYEPLPVVVDLLEAAQENASSAHLDMCDNVAAVVRGQTADVEAALAEASHVFQWRLDIERSAAQPMECRGVLARYDDASDTLVVHDSTQVPNSVRRGLAQLLGIDPERLHVIAPDIGGAFGVKGMHYYPEEVLVPWAARRLGRPVKWTEDRREHFIASNHERRQIHDVRVGCDEGGRLIALEICFLHDMGAYCPYGLIIPLNTISHAQGPYRVPAYGYTMHAIYTNTVCTSPYRGAGRCQGIFVIERTLERLAAELGLDRADIRRQNLVRTEQMPYDTGIREGGRPTTVYDSGDYVAGFDLLLDHVGYATFEDEREAAALEGRRIGLGVGCYVEGTGIGPYEGASVEIAADGHVHVATGLSTQGQSHQTTLAQIAADELGVEPSRVRVTTGDTRLVGFGVGTFSSRTAVVAGNAVQLAARAVREQTAEQAARLLGVAIEDVELSGGNAHVKGTELSVPLGTLAMAADPVHHAYGPESEHAMRLRRESAAPPLGEAPGLKALRYFQPPGTAWASGAHAAVVEVVKETAQVRILRYVIVHDCGRVINPLVVEGQVLGGFAQGIGGTLYERIAYDESGQIVNASFMDFLIPYATEVPEPEILHLETPSPLNELGLKGAGEGGVMPVAAVIANALSDALGTQMDRVPISLPTVYKAIART